MKIRTGQIAILLLTSLMASTAWSDFITGTGGPLDGTDVGNLDAVLGSTTDLSDGGMNGCGASSNPTNEECWAETVTGTDLTFDNSKTEDVTWYNTVDGNIAFELNFGAGIYIIKNGIGGGNSIWVLLENVASLDWGLIDGSWIEDAGLGDDMLISHVSEFNGGGNKVPEPGTLALLGLGLFGLGLSRRRKTV